MHKRNVSDPFLVGVPALVHGRACHDCDLTEFECHRVSEGVFSILDQAHMIENISEVVLRAFTHVLTGLKRVDIND